MKRFQLEQSDKTQFFLDEESPMRFVAMTDRSGTKLSVEFGGQHQQRPLEIIDVDEFIGIKSHRAKGKRITTYEVANLVFIEPEEPEEEELEGEDVEDMELDAADVEGAEVMDDVELEGEDVAVEPQTVVDVEDAELAGGQLNLF